MLKGERVFKKGTAWVLTAVLLAGTCTVMSGCEPLRKKFRREKKKGDKDLGFIPVLSPIEYAPVLENPMGKYKHFYALWRVWHRDLIQTIEDNGTSKKEQHDFDQMEAALGEMFPRVHAPIQEKVSEIQSQLKKIREYAQKPVQMRSQSWLLSRLKLLEKDFRHTLSPALLKEGDYHSP